jgi:hypothetical protein
MNTQVKYSQPQNLQQHPLGDLIEELPSDSSVPSHNEISIVDKLFKQKKSIIDKILHQTKDIIILAGLFILFSLPFVDELITKFITITRTSPYILIGVKAFLFVLSFFVIKNIYLVRIEN